MLLNKILNRIINRFLRVKYYLKCSFQMFENHNINLLPAHIAFFTLWSIVPLYVVWDLVLTVVSKLGGIDDASQFINQNEILDIVAKEQPITGGNIFLVIFLVYLSSKSFEAIISASNYIYGVKTKPNIIVLKVKSIIFTSLIALTFLVVLILVVIGHQLLTMIEQMTGPNIIIDSISTTRLPITLAFVFIVVSLLYHYAPSQSLSFKKTLPGTIFTTISWLVVSSGYSFYINNFADYNKVYSSFSGIIILMIWIYLISYIFVIGLVFNATYFEEKNVERIRKSVY